MERESFGEEEFALIPGLAKKPKVVELPLCSVLLEPKRDFPWVLLVPRRAGVVQINHLSAVDRAQLLEEMMLVSEVMEREFPCDRLNVAAIGNMSPQLHVHIICRRTDDPLFPDVAWNKPMTELSEEETVVRVEQIRRALEASKGR